MSFFNDDKEKDNFFSPVNFGPSPDTTSWAYQTGGGSNHEPHNNHFTSIYDNSEMEKARFGHFTPQDQYMSPSYHGDHWSSKQAEQNNWPSYSAPSNSPHNNSPYKSFEKQDPYCPFDIPSTDSTYQQPLSLNRWSGSNAQKGAAGDNYNPFKNKK